VVRGNDFTRDHVVLRETRIDSGEVYRQYKVDKIPGALMRLGYFKWVNPPKLEMLTENDARLVIELAEGSVNKFDGIVGYNPAAAEVPGYISGFVNLQFGNLFGTGRTLDANWEQRTSETQEFRLRYKEPWIFGWPLNIDAGIRQTIQDTSYVERNAGFGFDYVHNQYLSLFTRFARRSISPDSAGARLFNILPSTSLDLGAGMLFTTVDNNLNPQGGLVYGASLQWSNKSVQHDSSQQNTARPSFEQHRISIDFNIYIPLFRFQVFALALHGRQITSDEPVIPVSEQYRLGGTKTLRGYREEQFRGSRIAWSNLEYRYLLGRYSRFFVFFDLGYYFREEMRNESLVKIQDLNTGYGIGVRIDTKIGLFGVDYGLAHGEGFSNGKVHVGLINEF
jgi:outer membrane protein insertion porin family